MPLLSEAMLPCLLALPLIVAVRADARGGWGLAGVLGTVELLLAVVMWVLAFASPHATELFMLRPLNMTLLVLIAFIALVVLRYARGNLEGDPDNVRFLRWLTLTRLAVMVTVTSNNLVLFWLSWTGISLGLHQLLMFYPERPRAVLAAHKKFILARIAELFLAAAFCLLYDAHHTLQISTLLAAYGDQAAGFQDHAAALLLALVAIIKCAQLPVHGWLIQVVEAPTPVSALLHAGLINLGGFLLLLFAPLFDASGAARWLVLAVAGPSAVLAALVMSTRISVKVRLAWSTTAQMGLMLVECALGLHELALLHLLAHSCYKAYAFLSSGNAVNDWLQEELAARSAPGVPALAIAAVTSLALVGGYAYLFRLAPPVAPWLLIGFTAFVLLVTCMGYGRRRPLASGIMAVSLLILAYTLAKLSVGALLPGGPSHYSSLQDAWICALDAALFMTFMALQLWPGHSLMRRLFITLNAGFYLDEWMTRATLRLWPIHLPRAGRKPLYSSRELTS